MTEPQLAKAKSSLEHGQPPSKKGASWVTGLSADVLRKAIAKSFAGDPDQQVDGEPVLEWVFNMCDNFTVKAEGVEFAITQLLQESLSQPNLDMSIQTYDGTIASTTVIVDYTPRSRFALWWQGIKRKFQETILILNLIRQKRLPKMFTDREWKVALKDATTKGAQLGRCMPTLHQHHGPKGRHWYVVFVASNPDCQGQGYGSILMTKIEELADAEGADCYLECGNLKNKTFYEKFGFDVVATHVLEEAVHPTGTPQYFYVMVRRHRSVSLGRY